MVFSSNIFLFLFLPLVLILYFLLNHSLRNGFLLIVSLIFYAWGELFVVLLMMLSIGINYIAGLGLDYFKDKPMAKVILIIAIVVDLLFLFYYKYLFFVVDNLQAIGIFKHYENAVIPLPIGISFFTFHGLSYLVDVYRKDTTKQSSILDLGLYIAFFPQLIAGPIIRYQDIADQIKKRVVDPPLFVTGIIRFVRGLAKKLIIANTLAQFADETFSIPLTDLPASIAWLGIITYCLQLYFDFSGYSDMAIGLAKMFGFNFKENFNHPFISRSIKELWRRWHISLSTWFRDYLYIPLGGSKKGINRTYVNIFIVFLLTGLWHGASWNMVVWGLIHGGFLMLERAKIINTEKMPKFVSHFYLLLVFMLSFVFFRSKDLPDALHYFASLFGFTNGTNFKPLVYLNNYSIIVFVLSILFSMPLRQKVSDILDNIKPLFINKTIEFSTYFGYMILLFFCILEMAQSSYNPFIYFRF